MSDIDERIASMEKQIGELLQLVKSGLAVKTYPPKLLGDWLPEWMSVYKRQKQSPRTYKENLAALQNYVSPLYGLDMTSAAAVDMQKFINAIPYPRTRKAVFGLLREAFRKAYNLGMLPQNIFLNVELKEYEESERRALTIREQKKFVKAIRGHQYEVHFLLYLTTGIRRAEICRLDFDFSKRLIYVHGTKTKTSERVVPMHDSIVKPLKAFLSSGRKLSTNCFNLNRHFKEIADRLNIKGVTLHSLRHTFGTRCVEGGVDMKVVQSWMGHSTYDQTANRYTHVQESFLRKEARAHGRVFEITPSVDKKSPKK